MALLAVFALAVSISAVLATKKGQLQCLHKTALIQCYLWLSHTGNQWWASCQCVAKKELLPKEVHAAD